MVGEIVIARPRLSSAYVLGNRPALCVAVTSHSLSPGHFNSAGELPALANRPGALQVSLGSSMPLADDFTHPDAGVATLSSHRASLGVARTYLQALSWLRKRILRRPRVILDTLRRAIVFSTSGRPQRRYAYTSAIRPRSVTRSHLQALSCSASGSYSANAPHSPLCSEPLLRR